MYSGLCIALAAAAAVAAFPFFLSSREINSKGIDGAARVAAGMSAEPTNHESIERFPGGDLIIYFGSQTGTAEAYAQIVAAEGLGHGFNTEVVDLEEFSAKVMLAKGKAVFIMATYGRGDATDNAHFFYNWVSNENGSLPDDYLNALSFCVFGLGNAQYEHYNFVGRTTDKNLNKIGGQRMHVYGEGDDNSYLEEDFEAWKEGLWKAMVVKFGGKVHADGVDKAAAISIPFSVKMISKDEAATICPTAESEAACSTRFHWHAVDAVAVANRELRANGGAFGSTRHIEIDLGGTGATYHTADNLAVLPLNDAVVVDRLCAQLSYDPESYFTLEHDASHKPVFPTPCTVRDALSRFMDIMSVPRRCLLEQLVPYIVDPAEWEIMHRLSSKEGREEYHRVVDEPGWTLAGLILERFSSLKIPLQHFLHIVPNLHPRYYTISSSSAVSPSRVHITVAVLEQEKSEGKVYHGVCSTFLSKLVRPSINGEMGRLSVHKMTGASGQESLCRIFVRASTFRLPVDPAIPIIMIGPGTGVAPMRALLQERVWQKSQGQKVGYNWLYFGCRRRDEDFIYRDELEAYEADGTLDRLRMAFSREKASKVYVQHLLRQDAAELWELFRERAYVYVCGATHMGTEVRSELARIVQDEGSISSEKAEEFLHSLRTDGRYVEELWS